MSSDESGIGGWRQYHDAGLTILAVIGAALAILLLVALFAPANIRAMFDPVTRQFVGTVFGVPVWQLVSMAVLVVGSWLLIVDIKTDRK